MRRECDGNGGFAAGYSVGPAVRCFGPDKETAEADAPDLLEACKVVHEWLSDDDNDIIRQLAAAIAKAEPPLTTTPTEKEEN